MKKLEKKTKKPSNDIFVNQLIHRVGSHMNWMDGFIKRPSIKSIGMGIHGNP